jgi:hypothetical protein
MDIGDYFIIGHWWLFYWRLFCVPIDDFLLMAIVVIILMVFVVLVNDFFINGYWWLFY